MKSEADSRIVPRAGKSVQCGDFELIPVQKLWSRNCKLLDVLTEESLYRLRWNKCSYNGTLNSIAGSAEGIPFGFENRRFRNVRGFSKPQHHWRTVDVVVDKFC